MVLTLSTHSLLTAVPPLLLQITFVSKKGEPFPPNGLEVQGPFKPRTRKPPKECKLPVGFEVAGIIIENPKDMRLDIRVLAWLAHRVDVRIPVVNKNLLDLLTRLPGFKRLSDGDVSSSLPF